MQMRPSRVLEKLHAGKVASCFKLNIESGRGAEIAGMAGFDCIWADREHTTNDWGNIQTQGWAAASQGADLMVRVSRGGYSDYIKPLEMNASGILVPHIMSLADAKNVVRMTRFQPLGLRSVDGGNADGAYNNIELLDYLEQANKNRFLAIQIEDPDPIDDLDAIAALDGIDILFFGPVDFGHALGAPGQWQHPDLLAARRKVAEVCKRHGKFAGTISTPGNIDELLEEGYRFINMGCDIIGLSYYCYETQNVIDRAEEKLSPS